MLKHYLVLHPTELLCITDGESYMTVAEAMKTLPEITQELVAAGVVNDTAVFKGEKVYLRPMPAEAETGTELSKVPDECLMEVSARTHSVINMSEVISEAYCIEHNWEHIGDYWVIDCIPRQVRLVYNHGLNSCEEIPITV